MKKTRKYRNRFKHRGGATATNKPSIVQTLRTMLSYGLSAIIVGPLYILAEFLNIPLSNLNNISKKSFEDVKREFVHVPVHKMISGCKVTQLDPDDFKLQDDMYIHKNVAVVSCDKKGPTQSEVEPYGTRYSDSFLDIFGLLLDKKIKLKHYVFGLFQYIENIRETDVGRKAHIQKLISRVSDYKVLMKCYLIYRSIANECPKIKANKKTILKDEDVVTIVNPYYIPGTTPVSYTKRIACVYKHLTQKRFSQQDMADCRTACETCTFRNSASRLSNKYASFFSSGGCNVSKVNKMINVYYRFLKVKNTDSLPVDEKGVIPYLDKLNVTSTVNEEMEGDKLVLEKFKTFMCKYDILEILKQQIEKRIKEKIEAGYPMKILFRCLEDGQKTSFFYETGKALSAKSKTDDAKQKKE